MTATTVSAATFEQEVLRADRPVLVDFSAAWCGPCKALAPVVAEVARELADRARVFVVDVDAEPALAARFAVRSLPTLLFFRDGEVRDRLVGLTSRATIEARLAAQAAAGAEA